MRIGISYSWDSRAHRQWVERLADELDAAGLDVLVDIKMRLGTDLNVFMEELVSKSDYVLIICTPEYKTRVDARLGGAGFEASLITSEIVANFGTAKFVPLLRSGTWKEAVPRSLRSRKGLDMSEDTDFNARLTDLIRGLQNDRKTAVEKKAQQAVSPPQPTGTNGILVEREQNHLLEEPPMLGNPPPLDPVKEAAQMAQTFFNLSKAVDDFRLDNYRRLSPTKRKLLKTQSDALETRGQQYTADAMAAVLTQIAPHLPNIKQSTKDAVNALTNLNDIAKGLAIADAVLALVGDIVAPNIGSIASDIAGLWKTIQ